MWLTALAKAPGLKTAILIRLKRGLLATRVGEASHPGPAASLGSTRRIILFNDADFVLSTYQQRQDEKSDTPRI